MSDSLRARLETECLEDRTTPTVSTITSSFNGTAIPSGYSLWFSNVAKVSGLGTAPATVHVTNQTVTFTAAGNPTTVPIPDTTLVFSPATASASLDFDGGWEVSSPKQFSGNVFLSGVGVPLPNGLPGGVKGVVWSGDFTSDTSGLKINWQWSAAAYKQFSTDPAALGVKPSDAPTALYHNSDHAGTPEAYKSFVTGGARGGGGSNYTGSMSGTASVTASVAAPPPATGTLSGHVYFDANQDGVPESGIAGVQIHLTGADDLGNPVDMWAVTEGPDGAYSFTGLKAGTYTLTEEQPVGYADGADYVGTAGGELAPHPVTGLLDAFATIHLGIGQTGAEYNFTEFFSE